MAKRLTAQVMEGDRAHAFMMRVYAEYDSSSETYGRKRDDKIGYYPSKRFEKMWICFDNSEFQLLTTAKDTKSGAIDWCVKQSLKAQEIIK